MILILGGGFIGTHVYKYLEGRFFSVKLLKREELDYTNPDLFKPYLEKNKPQYVINCCGYTGYPNVDACETNKDDCVFYNIHAPLLVHKTCLDLGIKTIYISSGCIYTGYEKAFTELDSPNFGIFNNESSYYSKTKHIFELASHFQLNDLAIFRIRMPFTTTLEHKNYLYKIFKYNKLITLKNSLTFLEDLNRLIFRFCQADNFKGGIYNVVNTEPLEAFDVVELFKKAGLENPEWNFIKLEDLDTLAKRSNCILSNEKVRSIGFDFHDTREAVYNSIVIMKRALENESIA